MAGDKTLLTIAETAELLNCSSGFVRKRIALSEANQPGGWPKNVYVNLQPNGAKSLFRVNKIALEEFLKTPVEVKVPTELETDSGEEEDLEIDPAVEFNTVSQASILQTAV
jgi:hypothetical protein